MEKNVQFVEKICTFLLLGLGTAVQLYFCLKLRLNNLLKRLIDKVEVNKGQYIYSTLTGLYV